MTREELSKQLSRRRIFGIISHPDAGKTTLTEKLLLHGGAIREAGTVKARKNSKFATSDWMEIEKQRGISVTSSVMQFTYNDKVISIMDTPGHTMQLKQMGGGVKLPDRVKSPDDIAPLFACIMAFTAASKPKTAGKIYDSAYEGGVDLVFI